MKYLVWLLRAAFFFLLFAFSLNNQHRVTVHGFFGLQWQGPLVLAMLVAFALGLALGLATAIGRWRRWRQHAASAAMPSMFQSSAYQPSMYPPTMPPGAGVHQAGARRAAGAQGTQE
ncbi:hypothetical protein CLI92_04440 [Vandammella animalimorsus]|uniref:Lipopolysaccharide assembly protein A domain-containing protein n=1 Tax=Vandammella animalimorsus TaxID=2029117 RepID=A0A2A2T6K9_9BURK|nr:LapA family protein [Vandammella animalimorsus]PAT32957.1 hypothetical protein CK626_01835 [Vandammella animalimorsus]PAX17369.1 hypothetical protein CLI92_04440 [Vandammella animalimorsus]PAX19425.1 hypothetical protein CLI93_07290 [Vandammella animalimorsus]